MVLSFLTNPYNNYYPANSKDFISLDKLAKQDFQPETRYYLLPGNADSFAANFKIKSKQFGHGFLFNVPATCQVDPSNANVFTYSNHIHMLQTCTRVTDDHVAINANET
jgi:hypothetical protein